MRLLDHIQLSRVKILDRNERGYLVDYGGTKYSINGGDETFFVLGSDSAISTSVSSGAGSLILEPRLTLEHRLVQGTEIFLEEDAPQKYKEVMLFHELREMEYVEAGLENAHDRAVNDEVLYILKFFDKRKRQGYLKFATEVRKAARFLDIYRETAKKILNEDIDRGLYGVSIRAGDFDVGSIQTLLAIEIAENEGLRKIYEREGHVDDNLLIRARRRIINHPIYTKDPEELMETVRKNPYQSLPSNFNFQEGTEDIKAGILGSFDVILDGNVKHDDGLTIAEMLEWIRQVKGQGTIS